MKKLLVSAALMFVLMNPTGGVAQGCALCHTQAIGSGTKMIEALRDGILVLMFPPMSICLMIMVMAYRKRDRFFGPQNAGSRGGPHADLGW
jgi:hypothetical protein